jgi:hypothetical protein
MSDSAVHSNSTVTPEYLREIDDSVHAKVMGLEASPCEVCGVTHHSIIPQYSTNPAAAKQVREKLNSIGWNVCIVSRARHDQYGNPPFRGSASVGHFSYVLGDERRKAGLSDWTEEIYATSEELATCLCALKAVGVDISELERLAR